MPVLKSHEKAIATWHETSATSDADAIHDNVSGEITAIAEKVSPVNADVVVIEDSDDSDSKKRVQVGNLSGVGAPQAHASTHERAGSDEVDGDHVDIDFTPSNYVPSTAPAEASDVDHLAAHLAGIDDHVGTTVDPHGSAMTVSVLIACPHIGNTAGDILLNASSTVDRQVLVRNNNSGRADLDVDRNITLGGTVDGRDVAADGTKLDTVETNADVTDATNVNAAGAVMEADYNANTILAADADDTPAALTIAEQRLVGRITSGNIVGLTAAQVKTLLLISTPIAIGEGGTGQTTAQAAIDALSAVSGATDEHVLTKDTASGNAVFKAAAGGGDGSFARTFALMGA